MCVCVCVHVCDFIYTHTNDTCVVTLMMCVLYASVNIQSYCGYTRTKS